MEPLEQIRGLERKVIGFNIREFADVYALKTLYDYITPMLNTTEIDINFTGHIDTPRSREILGSSFPNQNETPYIDFYVDCYSDLGGFGNLSIDIAILKNCVVPMSKSKKIKLKQKYGLSSEKPILVIGYADDCLNFQALADAASQFANIYLVGTFYMDHPGFNLVKKHGVLKDYYAMADIAINARNIHKYHMPLHNFVEATEGGPLFMVPSLITTQYGYTQLVNKGVIIECDDDKDIYSKVSAYLRNFENNSRICKARSKHLNATRTKYLPYLSAKILNMAGYDIELPQTDLIISEHRKPVDFYHGKPTVRLIHPDTKWEYTRMEYVIEESVSNICRFTEKLNTIVNKNLEQHIQDTILKNHITKKIGQYDSKILKNKITKKIGQYDPKIFESLRRIIEPEFIRSNHHYNNYLQKTKGI